MDREAWHAAVHGVAESDTTQQLNDNYNLFQVYKPMLLPPASMLYLQPQNFLF